MQIITHDDLFCRNLRYLRTKRRYSQEKLAEMLNISVFELRSMESGTGETVLTYQQIKQLCQIFQVKSESLFHEELSA